MNNSNKTNSASFAGTSLLTAAAVGVAGYLLINARARKKLKRSVIDALERGDETLDSWQTNVNDTVQQAKNRADEVKEKSKKRIASELDKAQKTLESQSV